MYHIDTLHEHKLHTFVKTVDKQTQCVLLMMLDYIVTETMRLENVFLCNTLHRNAKRSEATRDVLAQLLLLQWFVAPEQHAHSHCCKYQDVSMV